MKRFIFCFMLCIAMQCVHAQTNRVPNPGFENASGAFGPLLGSSMINDSLNDWKVYMFSCQPFAPYCWDQSEPLWVANATANISNFLRYDGYSCSSFGQDHYLMLSSVIHYGANPYSGCQCNRRSHDDIAVRLANNYVLNTGQWYVLRYKIVPIDLYDNPFAGCRPVPTGCVWALSYDHLRVFASVGGPTTWHDNGNVVQELYSANWQGGASANCNWQVVERRFQVNTPGLTTLAFYAETGGFFLDDVELFEECESNYLIQNKDYNSVNSTLYQENAVEGHNMKEMGGSEINAGANVGGNNGVGNVEVGFNSYVIYTAPNAINLKPGFAARSGSHFHAVNAPCTNNIMQKTSFDQVAGNGVGYVQDILSRHKDEEASEELTDVVRSVVFPNPVKDKFSYTLIAKKGESKLVICNILSQQLFERSAAASGQEMNFDISSFTSGIYFLNEYDEQGRLIAVSKIIKE